MKSISKKSIISLILCLAMLFAEALSPYYANASLDDGESGADSVEEKFQDRIDDIGAQLDKLAEEKKEIEDNINNTRDERKKAEEKKYALDSQMNITRNEISLLQQRIAILEQDISAKEQSIADKLTDIDVKQAEIDDNFAILKKRLRATYMQDSTTTLGLIFGADSFTDFLTRTEYIRRIADHDRGLMQTLTNQKTEMENEKTALEREKLELEKSVESVEADRRETAAKERTLGDQISQAQLQIQDISEMERAYMADLAHNQQVQAAARAELDRIYKEIEWSKNAYSGGVMAWPLPGFSNVTCEYGPRFNNTDNHTGIDLSGPGVAGHNIVAANDGTVVKANWNWSPGVGYGIFVILDHGVDTNGNSISTLYAHCSNILVQVGQTVKKGEAIAQVGSTGWSTGPHLHFEVRVNQRPVNPRPYIFG